MRSRLGGFANESCVSINDDGCAVEGNHLVFPHIYCGSRHLPLQRGVVLDQVIAARMSNGSVLRVYAPAIDEPSSCI